MIEPIVIVTSFFALIVLAGIVLVAYLWNAYNNLSVENKRLQGQVETLLKVLEHYLKSEKENTPSREHELQIERVLEEIKQLRTPTNGVSISQSNVRVGQDMAGGNVQR